MKLFNLILGVLVIFNLSCGTADRKKAMSMANLSDIELESPPSLKIQDLSGENRKLIRKGELTIQSKDIEKTKKAIKSFVQRCNGYFIDESYRSYPPDSYYELTLNIDASKFDYFVYLIDSSNLNIVSKSFSLEDVTMTYIDYSTGLENKKILEKKYVELLSKAKTMDDILAIEEKLERVRTEIETQTSQLKVLENQISYSRFEIKLEQQDSISLGNNGFINRIKEGLANGWDGFKSMLVFLFTIWPVYIFGIGLYFLIRKMAQLLKKKN